MMLYCYVPEPAPLMRGESPHDRMGMSMLLYRRFWLRIMWAGLSTSTPHIEQAVIELNRRYGRVYARPYPITQIQVVDKPTFDAWYTEHWQRFHSLG